MTYASRDAVMPPSGEQKSAVRKPTKPWWEIVTKTLDILAEGAQIVMSLRDKPTARDWLALGVRTLTLGNKIGSEVVEGTQKDPDDYYNGGDWTAFSGPVARWICAEVENLDRPAAYWTGDPKDRCLALGWLGNVPVTWTGIGEAWRTIPTRGCVYVPKHLEVQAVDALRRKVWERMKTKHIAIADGEPVQDDFDTEGFIAPVKFIVLRERLQAFKARNIPRAVLLNGMPGSGKSAGARYLVKALGCTSLRITPSNIQAVRGDDSAVVDLELLLRILRPEVLVIDDVDRAAYGANTAFMLQLLEIAQKSCSVVIMSVNCPGQLIGALLRPGRIDDIVNVDLPDANVTRALMGSHAEYADQVSNLPIVYVIDFVKRIQALGLDQALVELPMLREQAAQVQAMTEAENEA